HFSAIFWRFTSRVVVTRRPPCSRALQLASSLHSFLASSSRPSHTKCGAIQCGVAWLASLTSSSSAALKSCDVYWLPDIGVRPLASRSGDRLGPLQNHRHIG